MPSHPSSAPQWKQEVNRRLAAHRSRRQQQIEDEELFPTKPHASGRAAQAAARVAARYASAPSFAALDAALDADTQAQLPFAAPLPGAPKFFSETHSPALPAQRRAVAPKAPAASPARVTAQEPQQKRTLPAVAAEAAKPAMFEAGPASAPASEFTLTPLALEPQADLKKRPHAARRAAVENEPQAEDNLLFFPSEPAPVRRLRSHGQESAYGVAGNAALSIFEVDPVVEPVVDSAPAAAAVVAAPEPAVEVYVEPAAEAVVAPAAVSAPAPWTAPVEEPTPLPAISPLPSARFAEEEIDLGPDPASGPARICAAPLQRRLMALTVDASLIALAFVGAAAVAASHMESLPSLHAMKTIAMYALTAIGLLYLVFFAYVAEATPGMCYAGLKLRQHNHRKASCAQRLWRIPVLLLTMAPLGLGLLWPIFDKEHLSLRDRLTRTYLWKH